MKRISPPTERSLTVSLFIGLAFALLPASETNGNEAQANQPTVLLNNDQVLFGQAHQEGDRIVIEQADGAIIRMPVERVLCWGPDLQSLYQFRLDQRERPSIRRHLTDARWCLNNSLYREAANELLQLYQLSPDNAEGKRLEQQLRTFTEKVQPVSAEAPIAAEREPDHVHVSPLATQQFTRVIQPILINRCGTCHDTGTETKFSLLRIPGISRVSSSMTHRNLQHVMTWIDTSNPLNSPLLEYAQRGHGGSDAAPLGKTQARTFESLAYWCSQFSTAAPPTQTNTPPSPSNAASSPFDRQPGAALVATDAPLQPATPAAPLQPINESQPKRLPEVIDPFDPEIFNRKHHAQLSN